MRLTLAALVGLFSICATDFAASQSRSYRSEYSVTALGIPIGVSSIETTIAPGSYSVSGTLNARGLAALFQPTSGSIAVTGQIAGGDVEPRSFKLDYVTGGRKQFTEIGFADGGVTKTVNEPEVKKHRDWIAVEPSHLANALDPISALLVPAASRDAVCARTVRVYDGAMSADIELSYLRTVPFITEGYKGEAVTCSARFRPISGYPGEKEEIAWLRDKSRIEVAFAPVSGTQLYAPVKASVGTRLGAVRIRARRFEALGE